MPVDVKAHSTRNISVSRAATRKVKMEAICGAASWASPRTSIRFYSVNVTAHIPWARFNGAL